MPSDSTTPVGCTFACMICVVLFGLNSASRFTLYAQCCLNPISSFCSVCRRCAYRGLTRKTLNPHPSTDPQHNCHVWAKG